MKVSGVKANHRRKAFEVKVHRTTYPYPFAKSDPAPVANDKVVDVSIDKEIGSEGFTYVLESGREGTIHVEQVLEYNEDPGYLRDLLLYKLTLEARKRVDATP